MESYEEKEGDEEEEDDKVEPHEQRITTDTKQGLGYKHVRKFIFKDQLVHNYFKASQTH